MQAFKTMLIIATGLGLTWVANSLTGDRLLGSSTAFQAESQASSGDEEGAEDVVVDFGEVTAEDIEADLARIEEALNEDEELEEFVPSEPLSADLGVEMPSDI